MSLRLARHGLLRTLVFGALLGAPGVASSQEPSSLEPGSRVRVRSTESGAKWLHGNLLHVGNDSLRLLTRGGSDTLTLATTSVTQVEVSHGRHSSTGQGLAIGAGVGAGLGLIMGLAASAEECQGFGCYEVGPEDVIAASAILAAMGGGIGALIGSASHSERWAQASLPRLSTRVHPSLKRVGIVASLRF